MHDARQLPHSILIGANTTTNLWRSLLPQLKWRPRCVTFSRTAKYSAFESIIIANDSDDNGRNNEATTPKKKSTIKKKIKAISSTTDSKTADAARQPQPQQQQQRPRRSWHDLSDQRRFFDALAPQLGVRQLDDWYNVPRDLVGQRGGWGLLRRYNNSLIRALQAVYPEHQFGVDMKKNDEYWKDPTNQRRFLEKVGKELGVGEDLDAWYHITRREVLNRGGGALLRLHGDSLVQALRSVFPEHQWRVHKFSTVPRGYWRELAHQRLFFDEIAPELGVAQLDDWHKIKVEEVSRRGGRGLLNLYGGSLLQALQAAYPEHHFTGVPRGHWLDPRHHRRFFDDFAKELGIQQPEDWYRVSAAQIRQREGGVRVLNTYGNSLGRALKSVYPEVDWKLWKFPRSRPIRPSSSEPGEEDGQQQQQQQEEEEEEKEEEDLMASSSSSSSSCSSSSSSSDQLELLRKYIESLSEELCIKKMDEWYRVSIKQTRQLRGSAILKHHGGLYKALKKVYPTYPWNKKQFHLRRGKKSAQRWLRVQLEELYPNRDVVEEFEHPELKYSGSDERMQLDVYIPSLSLAFEYQGEHHYQNKHLFGLQVDYQKRDQEKRAACAKAGIVLVVVPYWWDGTKDALEKIIKEEPSSSSQLQLPLPLTPPLPSPLPLSLAPTSTDA